MADWQDDEVVADQYEDAGTLAARQVLPARFSTSDDSLHEWLFDQFDLPDDVRKTTESSSATQQNATRSADAEVLTLGAGHGALWSANADRVPDGWDVTVTDAHQAMVMAAMEALEDVDREFHFDAVDARDVPYPDETFDAVTAHHVLYHLDDADRETALEEIHRVLKPGGTLYAATDGEDDLQELYETIRGFGDRPDVSGFSLATGGDQLRAVFDEVDRRRFEAELRVDTPEPLVAYAITLPDFDPADGPAMERAFRDRIGDDALTLTRDVGVFVARRGE